MDQFFSYVSLLWARLPVFERCCWASFLPSPAPFLCALASLPPDSVGWYLGTLPLEWGAGSVCSVPIASTCALAFILIMSSLTRILHCSSVLRFIAPSLLFAFSLFLKNYYYCFKLLSTQGLPAFYSSNPFPSSRRGGQVAGWCLVAPWGWTTAVLSWYSPWGWKGGAAMDRASQRDLCLWAAADHSAACQGTLPDPHHSQFCAAPVRGCCWFLLFAGPCSDQYCLTKRSVIQTLTLSLCWRLGSALRTSLSFSFHLMETANSFSSPSKRCFWRKHRVAKASQPSQARLPSLYPIQQCPRSVWSHSPLSCHSRPLSEVLSSVPRSEPVSVPWTTECFAAL